MVNLAPAGALEPPDPLIRKKVVRLGRLEQQNVIALQEEQMAQLQELHREVALMVAIKLGA
jgi:hypothetical protein